MLDLLLHMSGMFANQGIGFSFFLIYVVYIQPMVIGFVIGTLIGLAWKLISHHVSPKPLLIGGIIGAIILETMWLAVNNGAMLGLKDTFTGGPDSLINLFR